MNIHYYTCMHIIITPGYILTSPWAHWKIFLSVDERTAFHLSHSPAQNTALCSSERSNVVPLEKGGSSCLSWPWCVWPPCVRRLLCLAGLWWHRKHQFPCVDPGRPVKVHACMCVVKLHEWVCRAWAMEGEVTKYCIHACMYMYVLRSVNFNGIPLIALFYKCNDWLTIFKTNAVLHQENIQKHGSFS